MDVNEMKTVQPAPKHIRDMTPEEFTRLNNNFSYHAPIGTQSERYEFIRHATKETAQIMMEHCPESRELSLALTKLEEAMHWLRHRTNARIARGVEGTNVK